MTFPITDKSTAYMELVPYDCYLALYLEASPHLFASRQITPIEADIETVECGLSEVKESSDKQVKIASRAHGEWLTAFLKVVDWIQENIDSMGNWIKKKRTQKDR